MTQSQQPERDIYTRVAALEYQLTEIQNTQAQLRATIAPGGYVTDAFERVVNRVDEQFAEVDEQFFEVNEQFTIVNNKLDMILRGITGLGNS